MPDPKTCACGAPLNPTEKFCPECGASRLEGETAVNPSSMERLTADRLGEATTGEFEILDRIGHGAMGSVYMARDVALSRRVAIKVISPQLLLDESMVARFRLEAQTVAALRHPNIVNLHAVREIGDLHFFVMDFIDGTSLGSLMNAHGPLDLAVARALLFQIGSALDYAHKRGAGVIHRDIKPGNVMVDRDGNAVVMDFGISKVGAVRSGLTQTGATIGTPEYMSPEQCTDGELTGASDQYALGILAYQMLTGSVPFQGSTYAIMMAHVEAAPPPLPGLRPDCPPEAASAVSRMLAKPAADRFPDVGEAVAALGGMPLGHKDPVRAEIVSLVDSVSTDALEIDASSPLSPTPAAAPGVAPPAPAPRAPVPPTVATGAGGGVESVPEPAASAPASSGPVSTAPATKAGPTGRRLLAAAAIIAVALVGGRAVLGTGGDSPETDSPVDAPGAPAQTGGGPDAVVPPAGVDSREPADTRPDLPDRQQVASVLDGFARSLTSSEPQQLRRLMGRGGRDARQQELAGWVREGRLQDVRVLRVGDPEPTGSGAAVDFQLGIEWLDARRATQTAQPRFRANLQPRGDGWQLAGVQRLPG